MNIAKNNYPEETELDTNPSLTLGRSITLALLSVSLAVSPPVVITTQKFLILHTWIHQREIDQSGEGSRV